MNKNSSKQIKRGINSSVKKVYKEFVSRISTGMYGGNPGGNWIPVTICKSLKCYEIATCHGCPPNCAEALLETV